MIRKILLLPVLILSFIQLSGQNQRLLIQNVTVLPMHINQEWKNKDIVIDNGIITEIRAHSENDTSVYDLGTIPGEGKFLIPSYADSHAHLPERENLESYFLMNLLNGVTTLRSMRGERWHTEIDQNAEYTPRLILGSVPVSRRDSISKEDATKLITDYKESGFDFVKILSVKDEETYHYLAAAAKTHNMFLAGHFPGHVNVFDLYKSNTFQSLEHLGGFFQLKSSSDIREAIDLSIAHGVYHCATLDWYYTAQVVEDSLRTRKGVEYIPKDLIEDWETGISTYYSESDEQKRIENREKNKNQFAMRLNYLSFIYRQGGLLLLSQDASGIYGIPGFGIHTEMQHYADANISNYDILKATCYNLSEMLSTQNEWGTIKIGAGSDLVLLNSNPVDNIENSEDINGVILNGQFYSSENLKEKLSETIAAK